MALPGGGTPTSTYGESVTSSTRFWKDREMTQDIALNLKWEPTDRLRFMADGQYIKATVKNYDITGPEMNSFANISVAPGSRRNSNDEFRRTVER